MHVGVELLHEHVRTPHGFLIERFPTSRAKHIGKRGVWKIRQNDLAFQMNHPVTEVLNEILWESTSWNLTLSMKKREEEEVEEEPRCVIRFLEGANFLGAIVRKRGRRKKKTLQKKMLRKEGRERRNA